MLVALIKKINTDAVKLKLFDCDMSPLNFPINHNQAEACLFRMFLNAVIATAFFYIYLMHL